MVESLLTIVILFTIAGTLIPVSNQMKTTLFNKKLELHASEVAYTAINLFSINGSSSGTVTIEEVEYHWNFNGEQICVKFKNFHGERLKCIDQNGEV